MNGRQRELSAISHQVPDRIPTDVISIEIVAELASALQITDARVYPYLGIDGRIVAAPYAGDALAREAGPRMAGAGGIPFTEWGTPNTGDYGTARLYPMNGDWTVHQVEHYAWPRLADYDLGRAAHVAQELGFTHCPLPPRD